MQLHYDLHSFVSFDYATGVCCSSCDVGAVFCRFCNCRCRCFAITCVCVWVSVSMCTHKHVETNTVIAVTYKKHTYDHNHWEWERQKKGCFNSRHILISSSSSSSPSTSANWYVVCFSTEAHSNHIDALECDDSSSFSIDTHFSSGTKAVACAPIANSLILLICLSHTHMHTFSYYKQIAWCLWVGTELNEIYLSWVLCLSFRKYEFQALPLSFVSITSSFHFFSILFFVRVLLS